MTAMQAHPIRSQYEDFMRHVDETGVFKADRTGTGTRSVFGYQMRFDLNEGFPLVTTKKVHLRSIIQELLWFLTGSSDNNWLKSRMGRASCLSVRIGRTTRVSMPLM